MAPGNNRDSKSPIRLCSPVKPRAFRREELYEAYFQAHERCLTVEPTGRQISNRKQATQPGDHAAQSDDSFSNAPPSAVEAQAALRSRRVNTSCWSLPEPRRRMSPWRPLKAG